MIHNIVFGFKVNIFKKNINILFQKLGRRINNRNITITNSRLQIIHEISLEYDFSDPKFEIVQCNTSSHMPVFIATCEI